MSVFAEFRSQLSDVEGTEVQRLTFSVGESNSLSILLVSTLKNWSCVLDFDSVLHFSYTGVPAPSGIALLDQVSIEEKPAGPGPMPLGLEVGMNFPAPQPALLCMRTSGSVELEVVAAIATAYFERT